MSEQALKQMQDILEPEEKIFKELCEEVEVKQANLDAIFLETTKYEEETRALEQEKLQIIQEIVMLDKTMIPEAERLLHEK